MCTFLAPGMTAQSNPLTAFPFVPYPQQLAPWKNVFFKRKIFGAFLGLIAFCFTHVADLHA